MSSQIFGDFVSDATILPVVHIVAHNPHLIQAASSKRICNGAENIDFIRNPLVRAGDRVLGSDTRLTFGLSVSCDILT